MMGLGGNMRLASFLEQYDLKDESIKTKYTTNACQYYREQLEFLIEDINGDFVPEKPKYDEGRNSINIELFSK